MRAINLFGGIPELINQYEDYKKENMDNNSNDLTTFGVVMFSFIIVLVLILTIWCIYAFATFNLSKEILLLCIVLFFVTGPIIPLIIAYAFKNSAIK